MTMTTMARAGALAAAALAVLAATDLTASAQTAYQPYARPVPYGDQYRPLTVNRPHVARGYYAPGYYAPPPYNPYAGPATIVTAPIDVAGRLVALPFQVLGSIFPARGNNPFVLVGAPIHAAGQVAQVPFNLMQAPFGRPAPYYDE